MSALPRKKEIEYPTSDGQPIAETQKHLKAMFDVFLGLKERYREGSVWVGCGSFLYYEEGNPRARVVPDILLAMGVRKPDRQCYQTWQEEEGELSLVVEVTSKKTRRKDQEIKKPLYERLGVEELLIFDPLAEYLRPPFQGFQLLRGSYQPIPTEADGSLRSQTTGLWFKPEGERLRLGNMAVGRPILWSEELEAARLQEAAARQSAEARAESAEERVRLLEAELSRLRKV